MGFLEKECSKCNENKLLVEFNNDKNKKDGKQNYCKVCRNTYKKAYHTKKKSETGWIVYILPEENYAGISGRIDKRISNHSHGGKNTTNWYIHSEHERPEHAIIAEALLHLDGYKGCTYKKKQL